MLSKKSLIFLISLTVCLCVDSVDIKTTSGIVRGNTVEVSDKSINLFLNIPYAEPPVGNLRFSRPVPLKEPKKGIIDATKAGNSCFQNDPKMAQLVENSEDCLVLNVWSPESKNSTALKPVMFWIYGGAFRSGSSFLSFYDGRLLASHDVIIVSVNYRLGPFGFLYGGEESAPGNVGVYDQQLALKWVKQNIESFGGDPNQVTIFGESAGSFSVSAHILSPQSRGLFKRAILQSGAYFNNKNIPDLTKDSALSQAKAMAKHFNCSADNKWLDCLRRVDAKLLTAYYDLKPIVIQGTDFMPINAQKAFKTQNYSTSIDIMAGIMLNEGSLMTHMFFPKGEHLKSGQEFRDFVKTLPFPELNSEKISDFYLKHVDSNDTEALKQAFYEFYGDFHYKCPTYLFAKQFAEHSPQRNVHFYQWTYPSHLIGPLSGCIKDMGVCHASELEYVFGLSVSMKTADKNFSEDVMKMWTNFAKNGQPLDIHLWPRLIKGGAVNSPTKIKDINPLKANHIFEDLFANSCEGFWKSYFI